MLLNLVLCLFLDRANSQYDYQRRLYNYPDQKAYYLSAEEGEVNQKRRKSSRFGRRNKKDLARRWLKFPKYPDSADFYEKELIFPPAHSKRRHYVQKEAECKCSCNRCDNLNPCCSTVCTNCNPSPGLVLVPYPVPWIIHLTTKFSTVSDQTTTTTTTTTTVTTVNTEKPTIVTTQQSLPPVSYNQRSTEPPTTPNFKIYTVWERKCPSTEGKCSYNNKTYIKSNWRPGTKQKRYDNNEIVKPTVPRHNFKTKTNYWVPKYGIVAIPNHVAISLMRDIENDMQ